jgi:aryl-phospho-beta-D-glucosidase BglC (GH1 family)
MLFSWCFCLLSVGLSHSQPLKALRADGKQLETIDDEEVILRGVNLGQWLVMEGFMSGSHGGMSQGEMKRKLYGSGQSKAQIEGYFQQWRDQFITRADIDFIAAQGFNSVRIPLHYELFLTASQRAWRNDVIYLDGSAKNLQYQAYKAQLQQWVDTDQLAEASGLDGFRVIDSVVSWCRSNHMYVVLDMHVVPGTVGDKQNITDELFVARDFFFDASNRSALYRIWDKISERYQDEPTVAMYDLINEPHGLSEAHMGQLHDAYDQLIRSIRENGDDKLICLQGTELGNQYQRNNGSNSLFPSDFTHRSNLVYSIHRYRLPNNTTESNPWGHDHHVAYFRDAMAFQAAYQVPMYVGETGLDDDYARLAGNFDIMDDLKISSAIWTHKHHQDGSARKCLADINGSGPWDNLTQWSDGTLFEHIKWEHCSVNPRAAFWQAVTPRFPLVAGVRYKIISAYSGKVMEVAPPSTGDGDNIQQWAYQGTANQHWTVSSSNGWWSILSAQSGKALEIAANATSNGGNAQQGIHDFLEAQQWKVDWTNGHAYRLENRHSNLLLEVSGPATHDGANIQQWGTTFSDGRQWIFVPVYVTGSATTGSADTSPLAGLRAYPNPFSTHLTIPGLPGPATIKVYDALGQVVALQATIPLVAAELSLSKLPPGMYVLAVITPNGTYRSALVKQ